jgi:hypothetical protein
MRPTVKTWVLAALGTALAGAIAVGTEGAQTLPGKQAPAAPPTVTSALLYRQKHDNTGKKSKAILEVTIQAPAGSWFDTTTNVDHVTHSLQSQPYTIDRKHFALHGETKPGSGKFTGITIHILTKDDFPELNKSGRDGTGTVTVTTTGPGAGTTNPSAPVDGDPTYDPCSDCT